MAVTLLGLCARCDAAGVTSLVRSAFLTSAAYPRLLHLFNSTAIDLERLTRCWVAVVACRFHPVQLHDRLILVGDGLKIGKEGRRMPGVKSLHQSSPNNSKPPYIMGHSYQSIGLLATAGDSTICVPLASRLHEGIKRGPGERRTLLDKFVLLVLPLCVMVGQPVFLLADAYYASRKVITPLLNAGHHLVTRAKTNAVAYRPPTRPPRRGRGRPRLYGDKVRLNALWNHPDFQRADSPAYGETSVPIRYLVQDLVWRPVGRMVRFVLVDHPLRGRIILMTTAVTLPALDVVRLYAYRFKIEVSFKQAIHTIGAYAYHFWLKAMPKIRRGDGDQYLHRASPAYRQRVHRKIAAYELHVQLGLIAQGLLQQLAVHRPRRVWSQFRSWMRTMPLDSVPSEAVASQALRAALPQFLVDTANGGILTKFMRLNVDWSRVPGLTLATPSSEPG